MLLRTLPSLKVIEISYVKIKSEDIVNEDLFSALREHRRDNWPLPSLPSSLTYFTRMSVLSNLQHGPPAPPCFLAFIGRGATEGGGRWGCSPPPVFKSLTKDMSLIKAQHIFLIISSFLLKLHLRPLSNLPSCDPIYTLLSEKTLPARTIVETILVQTDRRTNR